MVGTAEAVPLRLLAWDVADEAVPFRLLPGLLAEEAVPFCLLRDWGAAESGVSWGGCYLRTRLMSLPLTMMVLARVLPWRRAATFSLARAVDLRVSSSASAGTLMTVTSLPLA